MKRRLFSQMIAFALIISFLIPGITLPVKAVTTANDERTGNVALDDSLTKKENPTIYGNTVLRADDPSIAKDSKILNYIDSTQFNAARHTQRLTHLEDLNTYVFANADGTRSVYMMDENVKYIDKSGIVKEKDLTLTSKSGGFGIAQSDMDLLIPNDLVKGIDLAYSGFAVKLTPQGLESTTTAIQSGNSVVYEKAYGENTKLKYTPLLSGVKEDIILTEYTDDVTYTFVLETDGLSLYNNGSKYYLAENEKADPVFYLGEIIIYDAIGKPDMGTMTVETVTEGQEYLLTVSANEAFLSDPTTLYPVTIDPSLTVSDTANGINSIEDAPVYAGYPNTNFGAYLFNPIGTPDSTFGVGRTVVRLNGLINSDVYTQITPTQIQDVTFHILDVSGTVTQNVNLHPLTDNTTWTESTVTWNNVGGYTTDANYGTSMGAGTWAEFDITDLVKAWKNYTYFKNAGFILVNENEANLKTFASSEYSTASYRPYVVMTYYSSISFDYSKVSIVEGGTGTLAVTTRPSGQTVTLSTSDSAIATVNANGVVTAKKAGTVTITASMVDADGITWYAYCTVYVYVANGVYHIKNLNSNYYLNVRNGKISDYSEVNQTDMLSDIFPKNSRISQMWKTYYLGNGRYSIRPMNKLDMGLDVTEGAVDIYNIGTSDTLSGVPSYCEWTIGWYSTGYVFKNNGDSSLTMQVEDASTSLAAAVIASTYSAEANCRWELTKVVSPPAGAYLYDTAKGAIATAATRAVDVGTTKSLSTLQLSAVAYSGTNISQSFTWYSSNNAIATVDANGAVTGVSTGTATIAGHAYRNGGYYYVSYTIRVGFPSLFCSLINNNTIDADKVELTDDGFFLITAPMSTILENKDISHLPVNSDYTAEWNVHNYFDDWYLFAVKNDTSVSYGLYKMREQEFDSYDGNDPGVTISFIGLDSTILTNCLNNDTDSNKYALYQALTKVTGPGSYESDDIITGYFANTSSDGAYLIAEKSVYFFANRVSGNIISASDNLVSVFEEIAQTDELLNNAFLDNDTRLVLLQKKADLQRIPDALEAINNAAGTTIFDFNDYTITVQNKNSLTLYEKQAILACFTADVTFNSFAAEVEFHAEAVDDWKKVFDKWYDAAIRADMSVGEEYESGFYDVYYDLDSSIVNAQAAAHGEY